MPKIIRQRKSVVDRIPERALVIGLALSVVAFGAVFFALLEAKP